MNRHKAIWSRWIATLTALTLGSFALTGCVAGNFGATRSVAKWNLRYSFIPRVLIYVVFIVIPVYPISLLFDVFLNNVLEFWIDKPLINAQNQTFEKDGYRVQVTHSKTPLRKSVFTAYSKNGSVDSVTEMRETADKMIELVVNGQKVADFQAPQENQVIISATGHEPMTINLPAQTERNLDNPSRRDSAVASIKAQLKDLVRPQLFASSESTADALKSK